MGKVYFVSDLHFNHKNILIYEPSRLKMVLEYLAKERPEEYGDYDFDSILMKYKVDSDFQRFILAVHDSLLIEKWNNVVKNDDTVWFLGDLGLGNSGIVKSLVQKLKGHKKMIMGNHDMNNISYYNECSFEFVSPYPVILKKKFVLSHAPLEDCPFFNIYGHVHSHEDYSTSTENSQCVCIERQEFMPITLAVFDNYVEV